MARSYGDQEERSIDSLLENLNGNTEDDETPADDDNLDEGALTALNAGHPSPYFYPPHYIPVAPIHPSNYFLKDSLDDFLSRPPSGPHNPADSSPPSPALVQNNYLLLSPFFHSLSPQEPFDDLIDSEDAMETDAASDDTLPEFDDIALCQTPAGQVGSCVSPTECYSVSGLQSSPCSVPGVSGDLTCCVHSAQCEQQSPHLVTYIQNPDYPDPTFTLTTCPISITLSTSPGGDISQHSLCGSISDGSHDPLSSNTPHLYALYDLTSDPYPFPSHVLNFLISVSDHPSTWNIRVAQIPCHTSSSNPSPLVAMSNCSQGYTAPSGIITSLNHLDLNHLDRENQFKACIMPDPAACAVKYTMHSVVCDKEDQVMIMGSDMTVCGMFKGREVVVPAGEEMGLLVMPGNKEQVRPDGGVTSYR